jgi:hypothetical protein
MKVTRDPPEFRPVTIRIETQDELDMLLAIIANVARNNTHLTMPVIRAAVDVEHTLTDLLNRED